MCFLKILFIYLFIFGKRGKEGERERNINVWLPLACPRLGTWPVTQACALTGSRTGDLLLHRPTPNPLSHTGQGGAMYLICGPRQLFLLQCGLETPQVWTPLRRVTDGCQRAVNPLKSRTNCMCGRAFRGRRDTCPPPQTD